MSMSFATATIRMARVEYRAATIEEIQQVDLEISQPVLPAFLFLPKERWREAMSPFPLHQGDWYLKRPEHWGPPGAAIWAQQASRSGDVIVGGRDSVGLPSVPVGTTNGDIHFLPARQVSRLTEPEMPTRWIEVPLLPPFDFESDEHLVCRPALSKSGPIICSTPTCQNCLGTPQRSPWYTTVACMCRD